MSNFPLGFEQNKVMKQSRWYECVRHFILPLLLAPFLLMYTVQAQALQAVPELTAPVIDQTSTLSTAEVQALTDKILSYEKAKGSQIVVLMVATTQPEDISSYAYRVASTWKIGRRDVGDGVLVVVAKNDRRMRIEVAKDLEGAIPDLMAARILDTAMMPNFRANNYALGLSEAVDMITARLDGEELPAVSGRNKKNDVGVLSLIFAVMVIPLVFGLAFKAIMGRILGSVFSGIVAGGIVLAISGSFLTALVVLIVGFFIALFTNTTGMRNGKGSSPIILGGSGWGGDSGGFGGGGGWGGSGGGGSFGGGGASGGW